MYGLGCMRLSTAERPERQAAIAVIHAALDGGARWLDTADAYALDHTDLHHNEALIAEALASWDGPSDDVRVATKGGLTRPKGAWVPDGRAKHLVAAAEASRQALGVEAVGLYLLHAPDPRTKLGTSMRALKKLVKAGTVREVGICNVRVHELELAHAIVPLAAVQLGISPFEGTSLRNGAVRWALDRGITVLAHSPFGGTRSRHRVAKDATLGAIARRHGVSPHQVTLAWLRGLDPRIVPLIGATRVASVRDSLAASAVVLTAEDWAELDAAFPAGRVLRVDPAERRPPDTAEGDVRLLMGCPASGKSSLSQGFVDRGYARLNRDEEGGTLASLVPKLEALLASGQRRVVLDNTYPDRAARNAVIEAAWEAGVPARCTWLSTDEEQAGINACLRMVERHGGMLGPDGIRAAAKDFANTFGPSALMRYRRAFEPPSAEEGFAELVEQPFVRRPVEAEGEALFVHADVLWTSASGKRRPRTVEDAVFDDERILALEGRRVVVLHRDGDIDEDTAKALLATLRARLPQARTLWCGHPSGPPVCWCRKPLPGLAVQAVVQEELDPARCQMVGSGRADAAVAAAMGMPYLAADTFFA